MERVRSSMRPIAHSVAGQFDLMAIFGVESGAGFGFLSLDAYADP